MEKFYLFIPEISLVLVKFLKYFMVNFIVKVIFGTLYIPNWLLSRFFFQNLVINLKIASYKMYIIFDNLTSRWQQSPKEKKEKEARSYCHLWEEFQLSLDG